MQMTDLYIYFLSLTELMDPDATHRVVEVTANVLGFLVL